LIERQIESAKLRPAGFIVTKGWNSLPLFPNRHSLESPGVADISISYRSAECPERIDSGGSTADQRMTAPGRDSDLL
jgi:hypothetical protein